MPSFPYQYAFTLHAHSSDVRNLCVPSPGIPLLLSGSRDGSAVLWGPGGAGAGTPVSAQGKEWDAKFRVEGPEKRFISCTGMVRHGGEAYLLTGSSNGVMSTFALPSPTSPPPPAGAMPEPLYTLIEHQQNLCCMDTSKGGLIASGSWDKTVIIWKDFKAAVRVTGHEQAVWAVKFVGEDRILTASADKTIVLHTFDLKTGKSTVLQKYAGHEEPVRGLSLRPDGQGFWSCGNDSLINVYSFDRSEPLRSLSGHTSFVYCVAALPGGGAISSGEDGTLRVWSETDLLQTIAHPATSLWSCAVVPAASGPEYYLASSANDGMIRFFTRDPALAAAESEKVEWEKEVSSRQLDKSQVGDVKHSDLPGMEALGREGKKDGQVIMVKNNDKVEAYQWQAGERIWQQIGQVVDAIGSGRKQLYEGQEYDYVFDVDVSEGVPPLKLPYNVSENPWMAAQRFLNKYDLPQSYSEQVVEFIHKNTGGVQLGQGDSSAYVDPFTGASRYTGASGSSAGPSRGSGDPFTGGSSYSSTPASSKSSGVLPVKGFLSFKQINVNAAKGKIAQLNDEVKIGEPSSALSSEDEKNLSEIYALLSLPAAALPNPNGSGAERYSADGLLALIGKWPEAKRFPLLDLARALAAISPTFGAASSAPQILIDASGWTSSAAGDKSRDTNSLLMLRALANLFSTKAGRLTMARSTEAVLGALAARSWGDFGKGKQAGATVALNYSILAVNNEFLVDQAGVLLAFISQILATEKDDSEVVYRASVALGNLMTSASASGSLQVGALQNAKASASSLAKKFGEKRLTDLAAEMDSLGA